MAPKSQTKAEAFLAPLAALAAKQTEIEGLVFWYAEGWSDEPTEILDSEEIAFYAEGLIPEGFGVEWQVLALPDSPDEPDHVRLCIWEEGDPPPPSSEDWHLQINGRWTRP